MTGQKKPTFGNYSKSLWSEAVEEDDDDEFEADFQGFKDDSDVEEDDIKPSPLSAAKPRGNLPCLSSFISF